MSQQCDYGLQCFHVMVSGYQSSRRDERQEIDAFDEVYRWITLLPVVYAFVNDDSTFDWDDALLNFAFLDVNFRTLCQ